MTGGPFTYTNVAATTAAVTNRFVTVANMKVGAYTVANASPVWAGGCIVTLTHTTVAGTDTLGTVVLVGTDLNNQVITETLTPVADSLVSSVNIFRSLTTITGVGWVLNTTADTIIVGCAAGCYVTSTGGQLYAIVVNTTAAATVVLSDKRGTVATLKASIAENTYYYEVNTSGYIKVATTSTNDVTVIHTPTVPTAYATS